ncbi:MAG TPA: hypothetical protein VGB77_16590 [Abditibacteriaceae bacterium]
MEPQNKRVKLTNTGQCANCRAVNARTALACIECGARLPWADFLQNISSGEAQGIVAEIPGLQEAQATKPKAAQATPTSPSPNWLVSLSTLLNILVVVSFGLVFHGIFGEQRQNREEKRQNQEARRAIVKNSQAQVRKFPITAEDLRHGETQVDQMMRDRPLMSTWVKKGDVIYNWVARRFAGESVGQRVYWLSDFQTDYPPSLDAYNTLPWHGSPGSISIREVYAAGEKKGQKIKSEELWSCAVFELFNISNWDGFKAVDEEAIAGKLSKAEYIERSTRLEFFTAINTHGFYLKLWQPWAKQSGATSQEYLWHGYTPNTHQEFINQMPDDSDYISFYSNEYDRLVAQ